MPRVIHGQSTPWPDLPSWEMEDLDAEWPLEWFDYPFWGTEDMDGEWPLEWCDYPFWGTEDLDGEWPLEWCDHPFWGTEDLDGEQWNRLWTFGSVQFSGEIRLQPIYIVPRHKADLERAQYQYEIQLKYARQILSQIGLTITSHRMWPRHNIKDAKDTQTDSDIITIERFHALLDRYGPEVAKVCPHAIPVLVVDHYGVKGSDRVFFPKREPYRGAARPPWQAASQSGYPGILLDVITSEAGENCAVADTLAHEIGHVLLKDS